MDYAEVAQKSLALGTDEATATDHELVDDVHFQTLVSPMARRLHEGMVLRCQVWRRAFLEQKGRKLLFHRLAEQVQGTLVHPSKRQAGPALLVTSQSHEGHQEAAERYRSVHRLQQLLCEPQ